MNNRLFSGARRLFPALLLAGLCASPSFAATLNWSAENGKERIVITLDPTDGIAGKVARIAPTGVLAPFTEVSAALILQETPKDAKIFKRTRLLGRALAIETQTPNFGFVVVKQTPRELVVDFFDNPLGSRWKPTETPPHTEIAPQTGMPVYEAPAPADIVLQADPTGKAVPEELIPPKPPEPRFPNIPESYTNLPLPEAPPAGQGAAAPAEAAHPAQPEALAPASSQAAPPSAPQTSSPVPSAQSAPAGAPVFPAAPADPNEALRPAPVLSAAALTPPAPQATAQQSSPPPASGPAPAANTAPLPEATPVQQPPLQPGIPYLDTRRDTENRAAPLPTPEPPGTPPSSALSAAVPVKTPPPVVPQSAAPSPTPSPVQSAPPAVQQSLQPTPVEETAKAEVPVRYFDEETSPPGVAFPMPYGTVYRGKALTQEGVEVDPSQGGHASADGKPQADASEGHGAPADPKTPPKENSGGGHGGASAEPAPPMTADGKIIQYVDKDGKPVDPPPDPLVAMPEVRHMVSNGQYAEALVLVDKMLRQSELTSDRREENLHTKAELQFLLHKDDLAAGFKDIVDSTNQAVSFNRSSPRNAVAYLRMGYCYLKLNNLSEASAMFTLLRKQYPADADSVSLSYYYVGDYYFNKGDMLRAVDQFDYIVRKYENSKIAREAALGLTRSYFRLGYYDRAFDTVDFVSKRWSRFYIEYPPFLNMMGDTAFRLDNQDYALRSYMLYVNLEPNGEETDIILTRIGDIYMARHEKDAADQMYLECIRRFPDKDGGLVAKMRMAENGVHDGANAAVMQSVFDSATPQPPNEVYRDIIDNHPESALVPLAELKLAMWYLWNKQYEEALDLCTAFMKKYPKHELAPKVEQLALQIFNVYSAQSYAEGRVSRVQEVWNKYPIVQKQEVLTPESRMVLAVSYWKNRQPAEALNTASPFFLGDKIPTYSEAALSLVLNIYLENQQWSAVREVARRVDLWELTPEVQQQLDYAVALSDENMGESDKAAALWQKLNDSGKLIGAQAAYALYFLAKDAERAHDYEKAYTMGSEALRRLMALAEKSADAADTGKIISQLASLASITETTGRLREALDFAERYMQYLKDDDPERLSVLYRMARIYKKQGNDEEWKKVLTALAAQHPGTVHGTMAASDLAEEALREKAAGYSPTGKVD